jgi:hypothetical protein
MLICDGCDKLYHLFCLKPPLDYVPEGDWFCGECVGPDDETPIDVEIEVCEGFAIEQRKRSRKDEYVSEEKGTGFPRDGWQMAISVIGEEEASPTNGAALEAPPRSKRRLVGEEETTIDGFTIHAKSTSTSADVSRRLIAANTPNMISEEPLVPGCLVAWFPLPSPGGEAKSGEHSSSDPLIGTVLGVEAATERALVRRIAEWNDIVSESWIDRSLDTRKKLDNDCIIRAVERGATFWIAIERLHIVGRAPHKETSQFFQSKVLPEQAHRLFRLQLR